MPNYLFTINLANRLQNYKKKCTYARVHAIFSCFFYNLSKVFDFYLAAQEQSLVVKLNYRKNPLKFAYMQKKCYLCTRNEYNDDILV